jgi:SAM-dependent methyltransferase
MAAQEIFENIYRNKIWGGRKRFWRRFYSGSGSVGANIVRPYIAAVAPLIAGKHVIDLGCGDFNVGRRLVSRADHYIGCDIARPVIEHNRKKFPPIEFLVVDAIEDPLPDGDIVILRQVLQHLDNASVAKILDKLWKYQAAIITEHIPKHSFTPNIDMRIGAGNRIGFQSGLVLTEPPFCFADGKIICEVEQHGGLIRTILHDLGN